MKKVDECNSLNKMKSTRRAVKTDFYYYKILGQQLDRLEIQLKNKLKRLQAYENLSEEVFI